MNMGSRTLASFLAVAAAATGLGALVQSRAQAGSPAAASPATAAAAGAPAAGSAPLTFDTFRIIARERNAGVVNISTRKTVRAPRVQSPFDFFGDDFFNQRRRQQPRQDNDRRQQDDDGGRSFSASNLGSGFVIDNQGFILTNRHVIDDVDDITVNLANGHEYPAKLIGKDSRTDVALIKIEPKEPLTALELGDSEQAEVGEWVMAIGQPFGLGNTVTVGVVSFKGRDITVGDRNTSVATIQTDAAINPGNSGGPLLNTRGQVIGINTMIATGGGQQNAGVGFAVAINAAKQILPQLREKGRVIRGWMGVSVRSLDDDLAATYGLKEAGGALVSDVTPGSPAEKAGFQPEDVVVEADGRPVKTSGELTNYVASLAPGTAVKVKVLRGNATNIKNMTVTLGTFPEEAAPAETDNDSKASLGMRLRDITPAMADQNEVPRGTKGVLVSDVEPGGAAERAGIAADDILVSVNGVSIETVAQFQAEVAKAKSAGIARVRVKRGQQYFIAALRVS